LGDIDGTQVLFETAPITPSPPLFLRNRFVFVTHPGDRRILGVRRMIEV
jgi:hypothetical protein